MEEVLMEDICKVIPSQLSIDEALDGAWRVD